MLGSLAHAIVSAAAHAVNPTAKVVTVSIANVHTLFLLLYIAVYIHCS